jgi:hypothetical protein
MDASGDNTEHFGQVVHVDCIVLAVEHWGQRGLLVTTVGDCSFAQQHDGACCLPTVPPMVVGVRRAGEGRETSGLSPDLSPYTEPCTDRLLPIRPRAAVAHFPRNGGAKQRAPAHGNGHAFARRR